MSINDGAHWNSLRLDMPAISVRDIQIKDGKFNSDLVAGTHGRRFWILDDVTPFRQAAEVASAQKRYLFNQPMRHASGSIPTTGPLGRQNCQLVGIRRTGRCSTIKYART
ncbi:MAG: hypothetical protein ACJ74Y_07950 [Bryobacteraceae bacterium]